MRGNLFFYLSTHIPRETPLCLTVSLFLCVTLFLLAACQPAPIEADAPTPPPSVTPRPLALRPTPTPQTIATAAPPTLRPSPTRWLFGVVLTPGDDPPPGTLDPAFLTQIARRSEIEPTPSGAFVTPDTEYVNAGDALLVGMSVEGRRIVARQFGDGERAILLAGGMHGGWEANTVKLIDELITHFERNPDDVLPGVRLILIPVINPDGLARGRTPEGRFNSNGVDLNRNWGCDWSPEAVWRQMPVNPGGQAFSEPETRALADFVGAQRPVIALFYHSAAAGVYAGHCNGDHGSAAMAAVLGEATGYDHGEAFSAYPVNGTAASWADGLGIASADVELATWTNSEFERNLRGIMALQRWVTGNS